MPIIENVGLVKVIQMSATAQDFVKLEIALPEYFTKLETRLIQCFTKEEGSKFIQLAMLIMASYGAFFIF